MRHRILILNILLFCLAPIIYAQSESTSSSQWDFDCDLGFSYEISKNPNWGINEPVVTHVVPNSPAHFGGLRVNDIIMQVRCDATYLRDSILIDEWLRDDSDVLTNQITIRNLDNHFSEYLFQKTCGSVGRLSESKLANMFEAYSPENSRKEVFKMPIHVLPMSIEEHDYSDYHSFDFDSSNAISPALQTYIESVFADMGVVRNTTDPDFFVKFNFSIVDKQNAKTIQDVSNKNQCNLNASRYNKLTEEMDIFPIATGLDFEQQGSISIAFVEKKNIDTERFTTIWQASIVENFSEKVDPKHYLDVYIPLILMQFPYTEKCTEVTFEANFKQFLYTGIQYDVNDMQTIAELDPYGPAYQASIYLGYKVLKIQDIELPSAIQTIKQNYSVFLNETNNYRSALCYFAADKNSPNHFWDEKNINVIQKSFEPKRSNQVFSYLFDFNKFINPKYDGRIKFEVTNGRTKRTVYVKPELKKMNSLRVIK